MVQRQKGFGFITPDDSGTGGCRSLEENQKVSDTVTPQASAVTPPELPISLAPSTNHEEEPPGRVLKASPSELSPPRPHMYRGQAQIEVGVKVRRARGTTRRRDTPPVS
jgi:hypothetical protein